MILDQDKIKEKLHTPVEIHLYESIDSTNNEAKRRADTDSGVHLYASTHQTSGRGRRGHSFYSPKDTGLYMTLSLPLSSAPASCQKITCAAAVAVCEAVTALSDSAPVIKWVNDVYVNGRKAAGILTKLITDIGNHPRAVIIGIGLNLCTKEFPAEFAENAGNLGDIDVNMLCGAVTANLIDCYYHLDDHSVLEKYKRLNFCIGKTVRYTHSGVEHMATAVDIDDDGGLIVEKNGALSTLNSGEISIIPV